MLIGHMGHPLPIPAMVAGYPETLRDVPMHLCETGRQSAPKQRDE